MSTTYRLKAGDYLTVRDAAELMGCSDGHVRLLIRQKQIRVERLSQRVQLVPVAEAVRVRESLTTRSRGKRALAVRPSAARGSAKKSRRGK